MIPLMGKGYNTNATYREGTFMINFNKEIKALPPDLQQEVIDFIQFLQAKHQKKQLQQQAKVKSNSPSVYDVIKDLDVIGCIEGPGDLSHNKAYLEGYGQ